ncbi:class I SAM-dependent RNA methyltransferase, partial [Candidatus Woesearchaeota archaeon]|nr:class I SAM-dependent RNA methyltransferase [Candidatus Woesearchaeota archaeon]
MQESKLRNVYKDDARALIPKMATPRCPYFGTCGGCSAQHIDYEVQLENKRKVLARAAKFENVEVFSGLEYGYRNRMDFIFHQQGLGLRKKQQWQAIVDIDRCLIANGRINLLLAGIRAFFRGVDAYDVKKHTGTYHYAVVRAPGEDSSISFVLNEDSEGLSSAVDKVKEFAKTTTARNIVITYTPKDSEVSISNNFFIAKGEDMIREKYLSKEFLFPVQGFFQNNSLMAEKMHEYCHELLKKHVKEYATFLDLYAGVGTFGINNSGLFKQVCIVENDPLSIKAADQNIKLNNVTNAKTLVLDAKHLRRMNLSKPLLVLMDPPRSGMHPKTIEELNFLKPEIMVYISCNVEQLGKDLQKFEGYEVKSAALF